MSDASVTLDFQVQVRRATRRVASRGVQAPAPVPRLARLLAQAHLFQRMVDRGDARDFADIARRLGLSRARVTQIAGLALLAPDTQVKILGLERAGASRGAMTERVLREIVGRPRWTEQREILQKATASGTPDLSRSILPVD